MMTESNIAMLGGRNSVISRIQGLEVRILSESVLGSVEGALGLGFQKNLGFASSGLIFQETVLIGSFYIIVSIPYCLL